MTEKLTLPRDVADALDFYVRASGNKINTIYNIAMAGDDDSYSKVIHTHFADNLDDLLLAIENCYTVEATPEEKVREYWTQLNRYRYEVTDDTLSIVEAEIAGIEKTLDLLGIKIEGVNA